MPEFIVFLIKQALVGFAGAAVFVGLLLALDVAGLRTLIMASEVAVLAIAIMTMFVGLTFASIQMGIAVMSGREPRDRR